MATVNDLQDVGWQDTRGEQGRLRVRESVGDAVVIPFRNLQYFGSTSGTGTGTSLQTGGFNEAMCGYGSSLLLSVGDDAAGSGVAVRMLIWGSIFGIALQSKLSDTDQPPWICLGVDGQYKRFPTVSRWMYYRQKRSPAFFSTFDDYAGTIIHSDDLDPRFPHLCEVIVPGDRAQATATRQARIFGVVVSQRAGYAAPDRTARMYSYNLAVLSGGGPATTDRIKRGEGTSRDGCDISALWLQNNDAIARTVILRNGSLTAQKFSLAQASSGETARLVVPLARPIAPANDIYLYVGEADNTNPVVATVITGA